MLIIPISKNMVFSIIVEVAVHQHEKRFRVWQLLLWPKHGFTQRGLRLLQVLWPWGLITIMVTFLSLWRRLSSSETSIARDVTMSKHTKRWKPLYYKRWRRAIRSVLKFDW